MFKYEKHKLKRMITEVDGNLDLVIVGKKNYMAGIKHPSTSRKNVIIGQMGGGGGVLSIQAIQVELDFKFLEMDKILTSNYTQKQCIRIHDIEFRLYFHFVDNRQ